MRIISGTHKGRRISPPKKLPVRPTTDRAKESLFNILIHQYAFEGCDVLDLFSGTGSISYEFASRGVASVIAVDQSNACVKFIGATSEALDMPIQVIRAAVLPFLERHISPYGFVFADPPYEFTLDAYQQLISVVFNRNLLEKDGLLIVEHAEQINLSDLPYFTESRNYGGCVFSFFGW